MDALLGVSISLKDAETSDGGVVSADKVQSRCNMPGDAAQTNSGS